MVELRTAGARRAARLAEALLALEEPWRTRFLAWVIGRVVGASSDEPPPTRAQLIDWLGDWNLYKDVKSLLAAWQRS